jgi:phospholipase/carboxylesterase
MNRIQISPLATFKPSTNQKASSVSEAPAHFSVTSNHQVFLPLHFEPNYAYPLIVWFHSAGDDSQQLLRVMPSISLRNYCAVAPLGPTGNVHSGFFWPQDAHNIENAQRLVADAIQQTCEKVKIAPDRIFFAGYGSGGTMAFRIALRMADQIAGVASINGSLPQGSNPFGNLKTCRRLPVLWAHCQKSLEFTEEQLCDQLKLLHIGGFNVTVRQYPFGDELPAVALRDLDRWVMSSIESIIA